MNDRLVKLRSYVDHASSITDVDKLDIVADVMTEQLVDEAQVLEIQMKRLLGDIGLARVEINLND